MTMSVNVPILIVASVVKSVVIAVQRPVVQVSLALVAI